MKYYYAAHSDMGLDFTYDSPCWTVHAFASKADRDQWVSEHSQKAEAVTVKTAYKISPELRRHSPALAWRCVDHTLPWKGL